MEGNGQAVKVGLEVDLRGEPTPRTAQRLIFLPPFAPAAETCARTTVLSKNCTTCAVLLVSARSCRNASNTPERLSRQNRFQTLFQLPELGRQRPPGDAVHREVMHRFQELAIIASGFASLRLRGIEQRQHNLPSPLPSSSSA
jgi:hypothetical protein